MRPTQHLALLVTLLATASVAAATDEEGFVPLFNGKDLTGWVLNEHAAGDLDLPGRHVDLFGKTDRRDSN